jgi:hypothetical protein
MACVQGVDKHNASDGLKRSETLAAIFIALFVLLLVLGLTVFKAAKGPLAAQRASLAAPVSTRLARVLQTVARSGLRRRHCHRRSVGRTGDHSCNLVSPPFPTDTHTIRAGDLVRRRRSTGAIALLPGLQEHARVHNARSLRFPACRTRSGDRRCHRCAPCRRRLLRSVRPKKLCRNDSKHDSIAPP